MSNVFLMSVDNRTRQLSEQSFCLILCQLYIALDIFEQFASFGHLQHQKDIRSGVHHLKKANNVWMLELFHGLDLPLDLLLHLELSDLVLVQDFDGNRFV